MESEPMLTPREQSPLREKKSPQRRKEPTTLHQAGQRAQHTTNELFRPPRLHLVYWFLHPANLFRFACWHQCGRVRASGTYRRPASLLSTHPRSSKSYPPPPPPPLSPTQSTTIIMPIHSQSCGAILSWQWIEHDYMVVRYRHVRNHPLNLCLFVCLFVLSCCLQTHGATCGVTVSMSAFLACHQCYCAGPSLAWGLNLRALVCGIFWSSSPGVFSGYFGLMVQPIK